MDLFGGAMNDSRCFKVQEAGQAYLMRNEEPHVMPPCDTNE